MPMNLDNSILPPLPDKPASSLSLRFHDELMSGDDSQRTETTSMFHMCIHSFHVLPNVLFRLVRPIYVGF